MRAASRTLLVLAVLAPALAACDLVRVFTPPAFGKPCDNDDECDGLVCSPAGVCAPRDAGVVARDDGGQREDGGQLEDAGVLDAGTLDGGEDGGVLDGGEDGGALDGGADGGALDGGTEDGGVDAGTDAGPCVPVDGGSWDDAALDGGPGTWPYVERGQSTLADFDLPATVDGGAEAIDYLIGEAVGIAPSGNLIALSAEGEVLLYARAEAGWEPAGRLVADVALADGFFGTSIAVGESRIAIGAPGGAGGIGGVQVFARPCGEWETELVHLATGTGTNFGDAVAFSHDETRLLVGAPSTQIGADARAGAVHTFTHNGTAWSAPQTLPLGSQGTNALCGESIAWSELGEIAWVGCPGKFESWNASAGSVGEVLAFRRTPTWTLVGTIETALDQKEIGLAFGRSLSASGDRLVVGAPGWTDGLGALYVYDVAPDVGGVDIAFDERLVGAGDFDDTATGLGVTVALRGDRLVAGVSNERKISTGDPLSAAGFVAHYVRNTTGWVLWERLQPADIAVDHTFGEAVGLSASGVSMVAGAPFMDDTNGGAYFYELERP